MVTKLGGTAGNIWRLATRSPKIGKFVNLILLDKTTLHRRRSAEMMLQRKGRLPVGRPHARMALHSTFLESRFAGLRSRSIAAAQIMQS